MSVCLHFARSRAALILRGRRGFFGTAARDPPEQTSASPEVPAQETEQIGQLAELTDKISDLKQKLEIASQDGDQATKRHSQALEDAGKYAHTKLAKSSLDLSDNLRRVHEAVTSEALASNARLAEIISDVRKLDHSLKTALQDFGIVEENPMLKKFDPNFHEAMFELPLPNHAPGTVAHVLQSGWLIHDRVLRPARVGVSK